MSLENFAKAMENTIKKENVLTENGAIGYKTSGTSIVDFNFKMSSYRNLSEEEIMNDFSNVYDEDAINAIKMAFFAGDIREGMGERKVFNACLKWLAFNHSDDAICILPLIAEYNRWDSLINLIDTPIKNKVINIINDQIHDDINNAKKNKSISLLAKWMPSVNTSSAITVKRAKYLTKKLNMHEKDYRKMLSNLRNYLDVVEVKLSANKWNEVDYNAVPSKANLLYKEAFMKHDEERRNIYLSQLEKGEAKINSSAVFPYDIIHNYRDHLYMKYNIDVTLEEMWKALPDYVGNNGANTICMVDGSGSMLHCVNNTKVSCLDVAHSLGIYFAEKMTGAFNNKYITFSNNPKLVSFKEGATLLNKIKECNNHDECENKNIEKAFNLILTTAINNHVDKKDMPQSILILSDMEFDGCVYANNVNLYNLYDNSKYNSGMMTLFEKIAKDYNDAGYDMPKLIFWNIYSRTNVIPVQENKLGVALISGFNPTIASMVFSNKLDPYEILMEKLNSERYLPIEQALNNK